MADAPKRSQLRAVMTILLYAIAGALIVLVAPRIVIATGLPPIVVITSMMVAFLTISVVAFVRNKHRRKI